MFPNDDWIWVNIWNVGIKIEYRFTYDAENWEYESDRERFNRSEYHINREKFVADEGGLELE